MAVSIQSDGLHLTGNYNLAQNAGNVFQPSGTFPKGLWVAYGTYINGSYTSVKSGTYKVPSGGTWAVFFYGYWTDSWGDDNYETKSSAPTSGGTTIQSVDSDWHWAYVLVYRLS